MEQINIYLVDDEILSIEYCKGLLAECGGHMRVVGEAADGEQALADILRLRPDVVLADISMPGMDGLELSRRVLEADSAIKIILLTSYREFEYAKQGLYIGVSNYLLKHEITAETLGAEVERCAREALADKAQARRNIQRNMELFLRSDPDAAVDYPDDGSRYALLDVVAARPLWGGGEPGDEAPPELPLALAEKQPCPPGLHCRCALRMGEGRWILIYRIRGVVSEQAIQSALWQVAGCQLELLQKNGAGSVVISRPTGRFGELPQIYRELSGCLGRLYAADTGALLHQHQVPRQQGEAVPTVVPVSRILLHLEKRSLALARDELSAFLNGCGERMNLEEFQTAVRYLVTALDHFCLGKALEPLSARPCPALYTVADCVGWLSRQLAGLCGELEHRGVGTLSPLVSQAVEYIWEHYGGPIAAKEIADYCGVSERYLRKLFQREMGATMTDYITGYRIARAKELLQTGRRLTDIYHQVGFASLQYFSSVFRRVEGVTPTEYQKRAGRVTPL